MRCLRNPIVCSFIHCNILYCIVERLSLVRRCWDDRPNHVKFSCIFVDIILPLCLF